MRVIIQILLFFFPWKIRRLCLNAIFHFELHPKSRIGFSILKARKVVLAEGASIGHCCYCKSIDAMVMGRNSNFGNFNYIAGFSTFDPKVTHFKHRTNRRCELVIGDETGITSRHYFDCNGGVFIGDFCQIGGFGSVFLTHSIDLKESRQDAEPIIIGDYCFIGLKTTILKGVRISDRVVVGAGSLVNKSLSESDAIYAGMPCQLVRRVENYSFFTRKQGFV